MKSVLTICTECVYIERDDFNPESDTSRRMAGLRAMSRAITHREQWGHNCGVRFK